jgi:hypothetical protein
MQTLLAWLSISTNLSVAALFPVDMFVFELWGARMAALKIANGPEFWGFGVQAAANQWRR